MWAMVILHFPSCSNAFRNLVTITDAPNLSATHLIHVNSPTWNAETQAECIADLDKATLNILNLADEQGLTSVAIPSISSGKYVAAVLFSHHANLSPLF
jgi:O-acetyl-ADP-ribose deacetylase (regulator of RNase III)